MKNKIISIESYKEKLIDEIYNIKSEEEIPKIANKILSTYGFKNKIVDITVLSEKLGFVVGGQKLLENPEYKGYISSGSSVYRKFEKYKAVILNSLYDFYERRYVLAVCISYYLLNSNDEKSQFYAIFEETKENEFKIAIKLAENILIPDNLLKKQINLKHNNSYFMSQYFKVPEYVIRNRLKKFNKL